MLYAMLICTDEACGEELEAWGELEELDAMLCAGCGCALQPLAFEASFAIGTYSSRDMRRAA